MKIKLKILFFVLFIISIEACSTSELPKLDPGRCRVHTDCKQGQECVETRCQDLYHPRHKIKTF